MRDRIEERKDGRAGEGERAGVEWDDNDLSIEKNAEKDTKNGRPIAPAAAPRMDNGRTQTERGGAPCMAPTCIPRSTSPPANAMS